MITLTGSDLYGLILLCMFVKLSQVDTIPVPSFDDKVAGGQLRLLETSVVICAGLFVLFFYVKETDDEFHRMVYL